MLEAYPELIIWESLWDNIEAIDLIDSVMPIELAFWMDITAISSNVGLVELLDAEPSLISWFHISSNPEAIHIIETNLDKINWSMLSGNPNAVHLLEANMNKINWKTLSSNPNAVHLLEDNPEKIDWEMLSCNPNAIHLLEDNLEKINWKQLSSNKGAWGLLSAYPDKIDWVRFCETQMEQIFKYDYAAMKSTKQKLHEEVIAKVFHPMRIQDWLNDHDTIESYMSFD